MVFVHMDFVETSYNGPSLFQRSRGLTCMNSDGVYWCLQGNRLIDLKIV